MFVNFHAKHGPLNKNTEDLHKTSVPKIWHLAHISRKQWRKIDGLNGIIYANLLECNKNWSSEQYSKNVVESTFRHRPVLVHTSFRYENNFNLILFLFNNEICESVFNPFRSKFVWIFIEPLCVKFFVHVSGRCYILDIDNSKWSVSFRLYCYLHFSMDFVLSSHQLEFYHRFSKTWECLKRKGFI